MTKNNKGRSGGDRLTPKTTHSCIQPGADPLAGWFSLAKSSHINRQHKRGGKGGGNDIQPY